MASKPTQRSLKLLRDDGYRVAIVEKWNAHTRQRQDLFGFADLFAIHPENRGVVLVQTTNGSSLGKRIEKLLYERREEVSDCLKSCIDIRVHGWRLVGARGKRKTWQPRIVRIQFAEDCSLEAWEEKSIAGSPAWALVKLDIKEPSA